MAVHHGTRWLDRQDVEDVTVVRFKVSRLREEEVNRDIFQMLMSLVNDVGRHKLVLNFEKIVSFTSDVISQLVRLNRQVQTVAGRLVLCQMTSEVSGMFVTMHLWKVFEVYDTEAAALRSFQLLERKAVGDVTVLTVRPAALAESDVGFLFEELRRLVADQERLKLVLDLGAVRTLPGPVLAEMARLAGEKVMGEGGRLAVCRLSPDLAQDDTPVPWAVCADEQQAVESLADGEEE